MNSSQKRVFIRDLCRSICREVLTQVPKMPPEWDGHELRVLLAERFNDSASMSQIMRAPRSRQARNFRNAVRVNNL